MLGRLARDQPFFFARIDSDIFGSGEHVRDTVDARIDLLARYAKYATSEQQSGREKSREMLLKPLNRIFDGCALVSS